MTVGVREFRPEDESWVATLRSLAFGTPAWAILPVDGCRRFVAELPSGPCGFLRILDYGQFYGGRSVPMGGVASVAVDPHARGRGVASALLDAALATMREAGQCVSALFPSVPPLYASRGWEQAGVVEWLDLRLDRLHGLGTPIELRPASPDDLDGMLSAYDRVAAGIDGMLDRRSAGFRAGDLLAGQIADLAIGADGSVRGYLCAQREADTLVVDDFVAADLATATGLLNSVGSWSGQLEKVAVRVLDSPACRQLLPLSRRYTSRMQPWMLRVVDLQAAIAARGWPAAAALRPFAVDLEIVDKHAPWQAGRHRLVVEDGTVRLEPGGRGAVQLTARALGPWYAGAASTAALRRLGLFDGDPTAAAPLDALTGAQSAYGARLADAF